MQNSFSFSYLGDELKGALSDLLPVLLFSPSFLFSFMWETSSKAPFRTYCQYSYILHRFFSLFFFLFAHTMVFKIPFTLFERHNSVSKQFSWYDSSFRFYNFLKHSISSVCWSIMRLVPITQGCPKHHQKFSNRSLI